ncbi:MAG TPA: GyrI-like domain-containing protein [Methanospirillum sp.]|nr:GyrI-like domain-containing protein [Methanospirillum sp.]
MVPDQEISVVEVPDMLVVGMRQKGRYEDIGGMLMKVYLYADEHSAVFTGPPIYLTHEKNVSEVTRAMAEGNADIEVVFPVQAHVPASHTIRSYTLEGGTMAMILHTGAYSACERSYARLFSWILENGKTIAGPFREEYLNDPSMVSEPELMTRIYVPFTQ